MWSKRPKPGGKGLRCKITVRRDGALVPCDRPAKRYRKTARPVADWLKDIRPFDSYIECCVGHYRQLVNAGAEMQPLGSKKFSVMDGLGIQRGCEGG